MSERLSHYETEPASFSAILNRFENESGRQAMQERLGVVLNRPRIFSVSLNSVLFDREFQTKVEPVDCPSYSLVTAGALFAGMTNPDEMKRLNQTLCGTILEKVDDMSLLSGRRGTDYIPFSQCWRVTIELAMLVNYMSEIETVAELPSDSSTEADKLKTYTARADVKTRNNSRQMVFVVWNELRKRMVTSSLQTKKDRLSLPGSATIGTETDLTKTVPLYIAAEQLNVGGPEYQEITGWVERRVLNPLKELVGKHNLSSYNITEGQHYVYLDCQKTAGKCPKRPREYFDGEMSLINPL